MSEDFKSIWRLTKASMMVLCDQVESDGKMLKTEDLAGLRAAVDKLVMTPSISTTRALPSNLGSGEKEGEPSTVTKITDAGVDEARQQVRQSIPSSVASSAPAVVSDNAQLLSATTTMFASSRAVRQSSDEPGSDRNQPQESAHKPSTSPDATPANHSSSAPPAPRKRSFRRFTVAEHTVLNEAFVYCRQKGVPQKEYATKLAAEMNRTVESILCQLSPTLRCIHMPRDQWESVMNPSCYGNYRRYPATSQPERSQTLVSNDRAPTTKAPAAPHSETECEDSDGESRSQDVHNLTAKGAAVNGNGDKEDAQPCAPAGNHAAGSAHSDREKPAAPPVGRQAAAGPCAAEAGADRSSASGYAPPPAVLREECHDRDEQSEGSADAAEMEHIQEHEGTTSTATGHMPQDPLPTPASSLSVRSLTSIKGPERAIRVISLAELQILIARKSPVPGDGQGGSDRVAGKNLWPCSEDGVGGGFLVRNSGSSSTASAGVASEEESNAENGEAQGAAQKSSQAPGGQMAAASGQEEQMNATRRPPFAQTGNAEPHPGAALEGQVGPHNSDADCGRSGSASARSNKRMAGDGGDLSASSATVREQKRCKSTSDAPAGPVPQSARAHATSTLVQRSWTHTTRRCHPYSAKDEAAMLTAYVRCRQSGTTWSVEMDALAVQLGRTPSALKQRCVDLWWIQQLKAKQH